MDNNTTIPATSNMNPLVVNQQMAAFLQAQRHLLPSLNQPPSHQQHLGQQVGQQRQQQGQPGQ